MLAAGLALLHEALSKPLEPATVLRLAGLFLDLLGELLPLRALGESSPPPPGIAHFGILPIPPKGDAISLHEPADRPDQPDCLPAAGPADGAPCPVGVVASTASQYLAARMLDTFTTKAVVAPASRSES
jgi:hypothetical protein